MSYADAYFSVRIVISSLSYYRTSQVDKKHPYFKVVFIIFGKDLLSMAVL